MKHLRALIVEDSPSDAELLCISLREQGYDLDARIVSTEHDFSAALDNKPEIIFADYRLPAFDGLRALQILRGRGLDTPFILVSGTIGDELAVAVMQAGADDFVPKDKLFRLDIALKRTLEIVKTRKNLQHVQAEAGRLAAIVESSNDAIISRGLEKTILSWNAAAERLFGWSKQEAIGQPITIIVPPGDHGKVGPVIQQLLNGQPVDAVECQRLHKDGRRIDISLTLSAIKNPEGVATGIALIYRDITQKKQLDAALRQSEERFRAAFEQAGVGMALRGIEPRHSRWLRVNQKLCDILGYTADELLQLTSIDVTPPEDRAEAIDYNEKLMRGEIDDHSREKRYLRKDGSLVWAQISLTAVRNSEGQPTHAISAIQDISDRKRAELALVQSEHFLKSTIDALTEHLCVLDETGTIIAINRAWRDFAKANGLADDKAGLGTNYLAACSTPGSTPDSDGCSFAAGIRTVMEGRQDEFSLEYPCHAPDRNRWFLARVVRFQQADPMRFVVTHAEITERKKAEIAHHASEAQTRAILEAEPECVKLVAADGSPIEINHAGLTMLEADSIEEVRRHGLLNFVMPEYRGKFSEHFRQALAGETSVLEFEMIGLHGTHRWMESHATRMLLPESSAAAMLSVTRDITERKMAQERIAYLSQYDALTELPNRNLFRDRLGLAIARGKRRGEMTGIMLCNIDRFKQVNDGLGLEAGDELLRQFAERLKDTLREVDTIARLGGDEFAIIAESVPGKSDLIAIADKLIEAFAIPFMVAGNEIIIAASIGISMHPNGTDDPEKLLEYAEMAMDHVKHEGGGGYRIYENESISLRSQRLSLETRLRHALERKELQLYYQPKLRLVDGIITGAEALLRWNNPDLGAVSPAHFIPVAEESGLIVPIGEWALRTACAQMQSWHTQGHAIEVAVNLSPRQFRQKDLVKVVASVLQATGLAPGALELEITEGTAMANAEQAIKVLGEIHALGVKLAVDDFGTGYSSLAYLKRFPLDTLKIDRSFVIDVGNDPSSEAIMCATIALAHSLKLKVVAEGVETAAQRDFLVAAGCNEMQGFLCSPALPAAEFSALLQKQR